MVIALIRLYKASGEREWLAQAEATAKFILDKMVDSSGRLMRSWLGTASTIAAFAEDYAAFTTALAELAENSSEQLWEEKFAYFTNELSRLFVNEAGEVSFCGVDAGKLPLDIPAIQDGVLPSTVAACAAAFIRAGTICSSDSFTEKGRKIIGRYRGVSEKNPAACLSLIMAEEGL